MLTARLTKKGHLSTDKLSLKLIDTEFTRKLLRHRELEKLCSTYLIPFTQMCDKNDRLHGKFGQGTTITGRLSSYSPNLQNIPIRSENGKRVRELFIPEEGYNLVIFDYNQIELRLLAHFSQDPLLLRAYKDDLDLHNETAKMIFKTDTPTTAQRYIAKQLNFSAVYGAGAKKFQEIVLSQANEKIEFSEEAALQAIDKFFSVYSRVNWWKQKVVEICQQLGYVRTLLGRTIPVKNIASKNRFLRFAAERECVNYIIQGSAGDVIKRAMIRIASSFPKLRLIGSIHDELIFELCQEGECTPSECTPTIALIENLMEDCGELKGVELKVKGKMVQNWGEK